MHTARVMDKNFQKKLGIYYLSIFVNVTWSWRVQLKCKITTSNVPRILSKMYFPWPWGNFYIPEFSLNLQQPWIMLWKRDIAKSVHEACYLMQIMTLTATIWGTFRVNVVHNCVIFPQIIYQIVSYHFIL